MSVTSRPERAIVYPDSDGKPMAENTLQFEWIVTIKEGLDDLFRDDPNVFVAGDLLWYPVEGHPEISAAPDALVAFGRLKGYRGSYKQWEEAGIAPQVVFEVLSPGNRFREMLEKFRFYERHGVEEYYIYDPDNIELTGYRREGETLRDIPAMGGHVSPRLGIRFDLSGPELVIYRPDGRPFLTYAELSRQRDELAQQRDELAQQRDELAQQRDELARGLEAERQRAARLAERLRALGLDEP